MLAVVVALAAAVLVLARVNKPTAPEETGSVAITCNGKTLRAFSLAEIKAMPSVTVHKKLLSAHHDDEDASFTGVPLREVLKRADPKGFKSARALAVRAEDGYVGALSVKEVAASDAALLAYAKDGESLGRMKSGGTGPLRLIITTDTYANRCVKYVIEVELR